MGEPLLSAIAQTLVENLSSSSLRMIGRFWGLEDELHKLKSTFTMLQIVLQHAEIKQSKSKPIQNWLIKLKDAAYDTEDILADIEIQSRRGTLDSEGGNSFFSSITSVPFKIQMAAKVKNIVEKISAIAEERHNHHLGDESVVEYRFGVTPMSRETDSWVIESDIIGRQEEKKTIVNQLLDNGHVEDDLFVFAICGMGGLGKTTLAQLVYNDPRIQNHFDLRIWVCVSEDFNLQRLVGAIIQSIDQSSCNLTNLDPLQHQLRERLKGIKFMLVLDDVWNENYSQWDKMRTILRCDSKGSTLVVTTRIQKIASMMAKTNAHHIGCLMKEDSWSLFKQTAFLTGEVDEMLVSDIGREMVEKCKGVPLAIKALGGLMQSKSEVDEWLGVKESKLWDVLDDENGISHVLKLSYYNLPPHMRQCFAYCCIFPKDYEMEADRLIQLWMANGLIPSDGQRDIVLTGRLIFKELVWRCFFQEMKYSKTICKMHDLMHDLAASVMGEETYILERGKKLEIPRRVRHLCLAPGSLAEIKQPTTHTLRSLVGNGRYRMADFSPFLSEQKYLRALEIPNQFVNFSPNLVCDLQHLKYLVMSCCEIKELPECLTRLCNLQTLKLMDSGSLLELPRKLSVMKNLCFLEIKDSRSLLCTPPKLGDLTGLRRLSIFIVGQEASEQLVQLKELNLEGKLIIKCLENVRNLEDAKSSNLMAKRNLTSLSLYWKEDPDKKPPQHVEEVLQGLEPHPNLEKLFIYWYHGSKFPNWLGSVTLNHLKEIRLMQCQRCEHLPPLGNLPLLASLELFSIYSIRQIDKEWLGDGECSFPALMSLWISNMSNLEEWTIPDSVRSFPCLTELKIYECPKLDKFPVLPTLRKLRIYKSNAAVLTSITKLTLLESFSLTCSNEVAVLPIDLLQHSKALEYLRIEAPSIRSVPTTLVDDKSRLKTLEFTRCYKLQDLPEGLSSLHSLKRLAFCHCSSLQKFPAIILEDLSSLEHLSFVHCDELELFPGPLNRASSLCSLNIGSLPKLQSLAESMQQLDALKRLYISRCDGLLSFPDWFGCLESLSVLSIESCKNMKSFPDSFRSLKSLMTLDIKGCPHLRERCMKPDGADWPKISHVPKVGVNWEKIQ